MLFFPSSTVRLMVSALLLQTFLPPVAAFATATTTSGSDSRLTEILHQQWKRRRSLSLGMITDNNNNNNNNNNGNDPVSELTSALARLDQQWQIQQKSQQQQQQQWSKLELEDDDQRDATKKKDFVYVLQPSSSSSDTTVTTTNTTPPRCMIVFIGGMGLGQFPQVVYNELLLRLCQELNAVVVAVPYSIITSDNNSNNNNNMNAATPPPPPSMGQALDHFELSKQTGERARKAILQLQKQLQKQQQQDSNNNSENSINKATPVYLLTHSLGGKLAVIYTAAMRKSNFDIAGMGLMSFNNFRLGQSFQLIKEFASQFSTTTTRTTTSTSTILDQLFGMAETALSVMGVEFTPTPEQINRLIAMKYNSNDNDMPPTRLFTFAQDQLDNTRDFYENACSSDDHTTAIDVSLLPGTHLTPVLFKLGLDQIIQDETARQVVRDNIGFQQASFFGGNDEAELQVLVREIVSWIQHGEEPTKRPNWMDSSTSSTIEQPPPSLLTGSTNTSD